MVQIVAVKGIRFFYNLTGTVGNRGANSPADVEFVRLGYKVAATNPGFTSGDFNQLVPTIQRMSSRGGHGPDLQEVIVQHERLRGGTQDGLVSPFKGDIIQTHGRYDGKNQWIVLSLDANLRAMLDFYPRLDKHSLCGAELTEVITKSIF